MQNRTAYLVDSGKFEIRDSEMPEVGAEDVLIEIKHIGVCGSDKPLFLHAGDADIPFPLPMVLGHEAAGVVVETGSSVNDIKTGDLVCVEPAVPCGHCRFCRTGRYNLCESVEFTGPPKNNGCLRKYHAHPANMVHKLPEGVSTLQGALAEPAAVALHAAKRARASFGDIVLVIGCGCIGLYEILVCRAMGIRNIYAADLSDRRLEKALEFGALGVINSGKEDLAKRVMELTSGKGFSLVFETAGSPVTAAMTPDLVAKGGRIMMVGNVHGATPMELFKLNFKEADVLLTFRYANDFPDVLEAIAQGLLPIEKAVTHVFSLEEAEKAFNTAYLKGDEAVKVVIEV